MGYPLLFISRSAPAPSASKRINPLDVLVPTAVPAPPTTPETAMPGVLLALITCATPVRMLGVAARDV
jgi:hypothetical protein